MTRLSSPLVSATSPSDPKLGLAFLGAFLGHVLLLVAGMLEQLISPSHPVVIHPTLRVDLVGLPDVLKKNLVLPKSSPGLSSPWSKILKEAELNAQKIQPLAPAKEMRIPSRSKQTNRAEGDLALQGEVGPLRKRDGVLTPVPTFSHPGLQSGGHPISNKNKRALDRIKSLAKIQWSSDARKTPSDSPIKGNQISPGNSLSGDAKENNAASYYGLLQSHLQENWALHPWNRNQDLSAQVQIFIDPQGKLKKYFFMKFSGNAQFDAAVKRVLEESQPFPLPPEGLQSSLLTDGVTMGFPL